MAHYDHRQEESWQDFKFNFPYARGLERLREEVLTGGDFDPGVLWIWGTMQAMAVIRILKACEREFGARGQEVVNEALREVGLDVGRQMLEGFERPQEMSDAELASFFATVINCIAYASLEDPSIESEGLRVDGGDRRCGHAVDGRTSGLRRRPGRRACSPNGRCASRGPYPPAPRPATSSCGAPPTKRNRSGRNTAGSWS